ASGQLAERFAQMVAGLGGPADLLERPSAYLASAPVIRDVFPAGAGFVAAHDVKALGLLVVELGGGRRRASDPIDHRVGLDQIAAIGSYVDAQTPLARLHAANEADADMLAERLRAAFHISHEKADSPPLVHDVLTPSHDSLS